MTLFHTFRAVVWLSVWCIGSHSLADSMPSLSGAPKSFKSECASCHLAYPPSLLVAKDWQKIMATLGKHYGTDASMGEAEIREISQFLSANASNRPERHTAPQDPPRMTQTPWFERKHRKIPDKVWADVRVKSASNCMACHKGADNNNYSERDISVPRYPGKHW
jgi:nitrate/TMAO reductase-like tetraheme cytochrome c subunit